MRKVFLGPLMAAGGSTTIGLLCYYVLHTNATIAALFLLLGVVLAGTFTSRVEAVAASVAATLCLDYFFIPPIGQISIQDPQGWLALGVFLVVSLIATNLSMRLRQQRDEMAERQSAAEKLHALNRAILLSDTGAQDVQRTLVNKCMELFGFDEAALFESATGAVYRSDHNGMISEAELRRLATYGSLETNGRRTGIPIALGNKIYGSFAFAGDPQPVSLVQALGNTMAVSLAQAQTQQASNRAEAVRRSEELKSVMIDALAHELKTPLTAIEAAADMLHTGRVSAEQRDELIDIVQQEAQRLRRLMGEAIHLARIEAKRFKLDRKAVAADKLIQAAIDALGQRALTHPISVKIEGAATPMLFGDPELITELIKQLLDNALKYSAAGKPIAISAEEDSGLVNLGVRDEGEGLNELEQGRIFDKFYRARRDPTGVQGTGMGLAIAREIAEAHGGAVRVESQLGHGSLFTATLPAAPAPVAVLSESTPTTT
jgi:two-component system sensor histidine kinase KdpD